MVWTRIHEPSMVLDTAWSMREFFVQSRSGQSLVIRETNKWYFSPSKIALPPHVVVLGAMP